MFFFLSTCISWKKFSLFNLVWYNNCHCNAGFESASNCNSSNYWYSSEDEYIWCWEQGYPYTQSHWGITSFVHLLILLTAFGVLYYFESHFVLYFQYSAKLLKKPDQCRAVYACSHLFWVDDQDGIKDGERCRSVFPVLLYDQNKYVKGFPFDNCSKDIIIFKLNFSCFPRDAWLELQTEISLLIVIVPSLLIKILEKLYREVGISAFCILIVFSVLPFAGFFCLKRALRIANAAQQMASATRGSSGPVTLFVEILIKCVLYYWSVVKRDVYLAMFLIAFANNFSGTCTFSRKETHKSQAQWSRTWLNWSQPKCRVITQQQILLLMLSLPAHWDTSSFKNRKVEHWAKNTSLLKCHYELPVWFSFLFLFTNHSLGDQNVRNRLKIIL